MIDMHHEEDASLLEGTEGSDTSIRVLFQQKGARAGMNSLWIVQTVWLTVFVSCNSGKWKRGEGKERHRETQQTGMHLYDAAEPRGREVT